MFKTVVPQSVGRGHQGSQSYFKGPNNSHNNSSNQRLVSFLIL